MTAGMTMPTPGCRRALVDGVSFRFTLHTEGRDQENLRVTVEPEHAAGQLTARFPRYLLDPEQPAWVARLIQHARRSGWDLAHTHHLGERDVLQMLGAIALGAGGGAIA